MPFCNWAEHRLNNCRRALIDNARREADEKLSGELSRLEALRAVGGLSRRRTPLISTATVSGWLEEALNQAAASGRCVLSSSRTNNGAVHGDGKLQSAAGTTAGYPVSG